MEIRYQDDRITFEKELTVLDELAINFSEILQEEDIDHVFVAGYVAILFGRSRVSEDIDLIVEKMSKEDFLSLWDSLEGYYCHNTSDPVDAYDRYLEKSIALRFSEEDTVIPNIEFKFASTGQQGRVLDEKITVELNGTSLPIASLESQISYKIYLGSEKDMEDARYLWKLFKDKLDKIILMSEIEDLDISISKAEKILGDELE